MKAATSLSPLRKCATVFTWRGCCKTLKELVPERCLVLDMAEVVLYSPEVTNPTGCPSPFLLQNCLCLGKYFHNSDAEGNCSTLKLLVLDECSGSPRAQKGNAAHGNGSWREGGRGRRFRFVFPLSSWHWHISFVGLRPGLPYISVKCLARFGPRELLH